VTERVGIRHYSVPFRVHDLNELFFFAIISSILSQTLYQYFYILIILVRTLGQA